MNINDNLKLAAYAVAADAFDKSKNIFWGFVPLVETALIMTAGQNSVSFLKLRDSINNLYNVSIPKDTLRYLINILVQEHKVQFIGNRTIVLDTDIVNSEYIVNHETAKAEIEKFFYAFQEFLISQDVDISIEEIRENVCQWIYTHSYELAEFIQSGIYQIVKPSDKTDEDPSETYWQYTEIFFNFLLKCRAEDSTSYHSFLKLFEGAIQSTLLNFKPSKIEEVSDKNFNIGTAILDTNFLLRLLKLQPELDNETAYITWTTLKESGTNFIVLDQTVQEICSSIKGFIQEIAPYTQQTGTFLRNSTIRTSGFWSAYQHGKSRTEFFELSKQENIRKILQTNFGIEIVDDFDDSVILEEDISDLIRTKQNDKYSIKQAKHDLSLIAYCAKKRPHRINSITDAHWWVLTNDGKLTFWNQTTTDNVQECITETQLSNIMWLQARKECGDGLTNTIMTLASKFAIGTSELTAFANTISAYMQKHAENTSDLDNLSLVFASDSLTTGDIRNISTDEDKFAAIIAQKSEKIKTQQHEQTKLIYQLGVGKQESDARLVESHQQNDKLVQENATLRLKLEEQTREGKRKVLSRRIEDLKKSISSAETRLQQLKNIFEFDKTQIAPAARKLLVILFITCGLFIIVWIRLFSEPLYQLIENSSNGEKDVLDFVSSGIVGALALLVYYVGVILIWGTPYTPAKLFCFLRDKLVRRKRIAYVLSNHYPSEYVDINLEAQIQQEERELTEVRKKLEEIEAGLRDL